MHTAKGEHMTKDAALKLALEALEHAAYCVQKNYCPDKMGHDWDDTIASIKEALAQPEDRNFCPRCGKRRGGDVNYIHTCTPPQENT
jgi:hypothetical protein